MHEIFLEFTRKLCNTRKPEFFDVHHQVAAKNDGGKSTLSRQNLRDKIVNISHNIKITIDTYFNM